MSLIELKLTVLEDYCKRNEQKWFTEYINANWKLDLDKIREECGINEKEIKASCMSSMWKPNCSIQVTS